MAYRAGYAGKVTVGASTVLSVTSWKATENCKLPETTDTGSSGFETFITGTKRVDVQLEANWDSSTNPYGSSPSLAAGQSIACKLYPNSGDSNPAFSIPTLLIEKVDAALAADGKVSYTISGKSSGSYTTAGS